MHKRDPTLMSKFESFASQLMVSIITVAELEYGVEKSTQKSKNSRALEAFLSRLKIANWDHDCAKQYAKIRHMVRAQPISAEDVMIASCALALDALLVTNNTREFKRVDGLKFDNWV